LAEERQNGAYRLEGCLGSRWPLFILVGVKSVCQSWLMAVVLSLNSSAVLINRELTK